MSDVHPLRAILEDAARGRFPPPDGAVLILASPQGRSDAVVAFTAHHVIAADVEPEDVLAHLPAGADLGAPTSTAFLAWLGAELGSAPRSLDVVLTAPGLAGTEADPPLHEVAGAADDRVRRAERYREDVSVFADQDERAVVILGRGLVRRREVSIEVRESEAMARGLGRRLLLAARTLVPPDEYLFAQVAAGNAASLRAFLAAGFRPIGAEVLFLRDRD